MGYPGAERHTHSSQFGYGLRKIWMDNVYCVGNEKTVSDCRYYTYYIVHSPSQCLAWHKKCHHVWLDQNSRIFRPSDGPVDGRY